MKWITPLSLILFGLGFLPHLAFTFFSPGLGSNGIFDGILGLFSFLTLILLILTAKTHKGIWVMVFLQLGLMALLLFQTFSDAALYIGT